MDVASMIERGRMLLDQGDLKKAATELTDAAIATRDISQAREIRQLADRGMELSGRFGKARWKEVARLADLRLTHSQV
jgi:hypothetical protein